MNTEQRLTKLENQMASIWKSFNKEDCTTDIPNISIGQTFKHNIFHQVKVTAIEDTNKERFRGVVYSTEEGAEAFKVGKVIDCFTSNYSRITEQDDIIDQNKQDEPCLQEVMSEETPLEKAKRLYKVGTKFVDITAKKNIILPGKIYYQCGDSISVNTQNGIKHIQYQGEWAEIVEP